MSTAADTELYIHRTDHLGMVALVSTVADSRRFVRRVCASWRVDQEQIQDATLLASELVSNAITASVSAGPSSGHNAPDSDVKSIGMRLVDLGHSLVIEVRDSSSHPPKLTEPSLEAEHGRGLQLVDALSIRWGHYTRGGGKVVWCQLALDTDVPEREAADDLEAVQRVVEVLQANPWDDSA